MATCSVAGCQISSSGLLPAQAKETFKLSGEALIRYPDSWTSGKGQEHLTGWDGRDQCIALWLTSPEQTTRPALFA